MAHATANNHAQAWRTRHEHRDAAEWRRNLERAARAGFPRTQRGVRSALVMSVWQSDRARWERHLLVSAHVNTAPPPPPLPAFAHEPARVALCYQLEATAPSLRPEPPAAQRVIDAATEFARQQCIALVEEMRTWKPAA